MGPSDSANPATASGVRWLLLSLGLAAVADLVMDVPVYFGTALPELEALFMTASYQLYAPILSVVVPTGVGLIGFAGILRIERGRGLDPRMAGGASSARVLRRRRCGAGPVRFRARRGTRLW